jgi:hypothetical protein
MKKIDKSLTSTFLSDISEPPATGNMQADPQVPKERKPSDEADKGTLVYVRLRGIRQNHENDPESIVHSTRGKGA